MTSVGVTGHRALVSSPALVRAIDQALAAIATAFPGSELALVSPLAEGADQLVVERAFALGHTRLIVPLPMPQDRYLRTFVSLQSRSAFLRLLGRADEVVTLPPTASDVEAYQAVGHWVLNRADVLIAVWDGQPSVGGGGTGEVVAAARQRGLPVAWVHANRPGISEGGPECLLPLETTVTFENF